VSLLEDRPPQLYLHEITLPVPGTYAQWNSHGLDIWMEREQVEPPDRPLLRPIDVALNALAFTTSPLLVEDIRISMCRLVPPIWQYCHEKGSPEFTQGRLLAELDNWRAYAEKISLLCDAADMQCPHFGRLLMFYRGQEDETTEPGQMVVINRVRELVEEALSFEAILRACLLAGPGRGVPKLTCGGGILTLTSSDAR
jgi:hypothetical protein